MKIINSTFGAVLQKFPLCPDTLGCKSLLLSEKCFFPLNFCFKNNCQCFLKYVLFVHKKMPEKQLEKVH
uniref:Uncharacterized protein n=1 Tax=Meloidogyne enterolobii TaxID=390850 RepID=A0A6V7VJG3_MELEN|nr:unnamed protein product [Meloidogyne enterolobii]